MSDRRHVSYRDHPYAPDDVEPLASPVFTDDTPSLQTYAVVYNASDPSSEFGFKDQCHITARSVEDAIEVLERWLSTYEISVVGLIHCKGWETL